MARSASSTREEQRRMIPPFTARGDGDRVDLRPKEAMMSLRKFGNPLRGVLLLGALPTLQADILYSVTDLGLSGGASSDVAAINNVGQVVGQRSLHAAV